MYGFAFTISQRSWLRFGRGVQYRNDAVSLSIGICQDTKSWVGLDWVGLGGLVSTRLLVVADVDD
jgi:hypothetical protein